MTDVFDKATRSRIMAGVRTAHTAPETLLVELLESAGLALRRQATELPGSPDVVIDRVRIALFVDGDFWHGRAWFDARIAPGQNRAFWISKFEKNRERDRAADARLRARGWSVLRIWASDLKKDPARVVTAVRSRVSRRGRR
jgi:DNA mismatch endonuclease, patch repair protein